MTPPWLRLLDPSYRLTLALNDYHPNDEQRLAQRRRFRDANNPNPPTTTAPVVTPAPTPSVDSIPSTTSITLRGEEAPQAQQAIIVGGNTVRPPRTDSVNNCNFTRSVRTFDYTNPAGGEDHFVQVLDAQVRPGFRICSVGTGFNWGNAGISSAFRDLNLGILVGPERSDSGFLQMEAHLGEGIVGYLRLSGGSLSLDGASYLNGAPMSPDTTPSVSGGWGALGVGLSHRATHVGTWKEVFRGNTSRVGVQLGFTSLHVDNPAPGTSGDAHTNFRFSITRESDLLGINVPYGRIALELFPGVVNFTSDDGAAPGCHGAFCSWSDMLHRSPFIPLSVRYDFYLDTPSTASDRWVAPGESRPISTEEFVFNLANRGAGELINLWGRGASTHEFIGVQAGLGTGGAGLSTSRDQYSTAGLAQFALSSMRGMSRGSDVIAEGDILRNNRSSERMWGIIGTEGFFFLLNMSFYLGLRNGPGNNWTANDFWACAGSASGSSEACARNPYADSNGGSARMNFFEGIGYGGLLALDATGLMGDPRRGDGHFWGANFAAGALGLVGMFTADKLAGFDGGNGLFGWSVAGDSSPFFNGFRGTYDPIADNFLRRRQDANILTSTSAMLLSYSLGRFINYFSYQSAARDAILSDPRVNPESQRNSNYRPGLRSARLNILPGGASLSLSGEF